jgi:uncharacterized protein YdhG (YjbR/CyaY superfamily)
MFSEYILQLPEERQQAMLTIIQTLQTHLPEGFTPQIQYNMPSFVVPHSIYPSGYHCNTKEPLPFISIASQKNYIALHHLGLYSSPDLLDWFVNEYPKHSKYSLDMGKGCIRFKKMHDIPYNLLSELFTKLTPAEWIENYEKQLGKQKL